MPTKIEWAEETWNPITGCSKISEGCQNCYAERMSKRLAGRYGYQKAPNNFRPTFHRDRLTQPRLWKKPRRIFVCSMADILHDDVDRWWIDDIVDACMAAPWHRYLFLTKRPHNFEKKFGGISSKQLEFLVDNVHWGATIENQPRADERISILLTIPAAIHFVSIEPMLGPVDLESIDYGAPYPLKMAALSGYFLNNKHVKIDLVICGAETGPRKRHMKLDWARSLRDQCADAVTPFFFKKDSNGNHELDGQVWEQLPA